MNFKNKRTHIFIKICITHTLFWINLLIDSLVKGQYITFIPSLFFKMSTCGHFPHIPLHPPHTHILPIMLKDNNSKNTKRNYLNNSKNNTIFKQLKGDLSLCNAVIWLRRDFFNIIIFSFYISFSLVRLRTFRLVHGLVRCTRDVTIRDVTIKTPDRKWDRGTWMISCPEALRILEFEKP